VSDELSANLQTFLDTVPAVTKRYTDSLEGVKKANPRVRLNRGREVLSPLLRCRESPQGDAPEPVPRRLTDDPEMSPPRRLPAAKEGDPSFEAAPPSPAKPLPATPAKSEPHGPFARRGSGAPPPQDQELVNHTQRLKAEAYELRVVLSGICDWIEMQMPAIKLEDNRGVAVQEQVIRHVVHMRTAVQGVYERDRLYMEKLAEYSSKYYKHPEAKSQWAGTIEAWNEEHWDQLERDWREMRHIVVLAARLLSLNMDKLAAPREDAGGQSGGVGMAYM